MKTAGMLETMFEATAGAVVAEDLPHGNPFFEDWMVRPAVRQLSSGADELFLLDLPGDAGVLPLARWRGLPPGIGNVYSVWSHIHCFDTTAPVAGDSCAAVEAIRSALAERRAHMLRWPQLPTDTSFYARLGECLAMHGLEARETKRFVRPFLDADAKGGSAAALQRLSAKRVREFRRTRRRLEEMGKLELRVIEDEHDAADWVGDFMEIEASGWKGSEGTAFAQRPRERDYLVEIVTAAARDGRCLVYSLELDGRPIAMSVNFRSCRKVWAFKTAYRDELARFAPGALLEFESMLLACDDPNIGWIDSGMTHDQGLIAELWSGRREMVDLLISTRPANNKLVRVGAKLWRAYIAARRNTQETVARLGRSASVAMKKPAA